MACRACLSALPGHDEIFPYCERGKDTSALRHEADAEMRDAFGAETCNRLAKQPDFAFARRQEADDSGDAGGLAGAVAPNSASTWPDAAKS